MSLRASTIEVANRESHDYETATHVSSMFNQASRLKTRAVRIVDLISLRQDHVMAIGLFRSPALPL